MPSQNLDLSDARAVHETWQSSSPALAKAIEEAEILLTYAAQHGIVPGEKTLQILLRSKRLERSKNWSVDDETRFWLAFDELVEIVHPVTPETLASSLPPTETSEAQEERMTARARWSHGWRKFFKPLGFGKYNPPISQARESVQRYTKFAFFSLVALLIVQIYWVVGSHVVLDVNSLFQKRAEVSNSISRLMSAKGLDPEHMALAELQDPEVKALRKKYKFYEQKLDASYELLLKWNNVWLFLLNQPPFEGKVTPYNSFAFEMEQDFLKTELGVLRKSLGEINEMSSIKTNSPPTQATPHAQKNEQGYMADNALSKTDVGLVEGVAENLEDNVYPINSEATVVSVDASKPDTTPVDRTTAVQPNGDLDVMPTQRRTDSTDKVVEQTALIVMQPKLGLSSEELRGIERQVTDLSKEIYQNRLQHEYDKARNRFFLNIASASFALEALQIYFLPLLYGLLGACTYVLRQLSMEVKQLTYSRVSEIRYGLRLALGALGGMAISWFIKPDDASGLASLGPLALAFLTGYNVELLFAIMDKIINSALKSLQTEEEKALEKQGHLPSQSNQTPIGTVQNRDASIDNVNVPPPGPPPSATAKATAQASSDPAVPLKRPEPKLRSEDDSG